MDTTTGSVLMVWYAPREATELNVMPDKAGQAQRGSKIFPTQYVWEGNVEPGTRVQFVTVLLPHAPTPDASELAARITVLADRPGLAPIVAIPLYSRSSRVVYVDVVPEQENRDRIVTGNRAPHPLVPGHISGSAAEDDLEPSRFANSREGAERESLRLLLAVYQQRVVILGGGL